MLSTAAPSAAALLAAAWGDPLGDASPLESAATAAAAVTIDRGGDDSGSSSATALPAPGVESSPLHSALSIVGVLGTSGRGDGSRCARRASMP